MFIGLTSTNGEAIYLRVDEIVEFQSRIKDPEAVKRRVKASIRLKGDEMGVAVKESCEEIIKRIAVAKKSSKGSQ